MRKSKIFVEVGESVFAVYLLIHQTLEIGIASCLIKTTASET